MKHIWKRLLAAALCLLLVFAFAGCSALDEARENQAFSLGYGEVRWNGDLYKALPENEYFCPVMPNGRSLCLTTEDVPVLLRDMFALAYLQVSEDKTLLQDYSGEIAYCREDKFDQMAQRMILPFVPEELCFQYGYYDYEKDQYVDKFYTLNQVQVDAINTVLKDVTPRKMDKNTQFSGQTIMVQESSADHLMRRDHVEIAIEGLGAYLMVDGGKDTLVYTIPDALYSVFSELTTMYENIY